MTIKEGQEKLADALLRPINPSAVIILGLATIMWGLWIVLPFWDVFSISSVYSTLLATHIPEFCWGLLAIGCGMITTWGATVRKTTPLKIGSMVAGWHWLMITIFYISGNWMDSTWVFTLMFALYAAYVAMNLRVNSSKHKND